MNFRAGNFYQAWRESNGPATVLHEEGAPPPERLLQSIWQHQRLRRTELHTVDGLKIRVFHPGFSSAEGGPDFRDAVLQIGGGPVVTGDVEVDLKPGGWHAHGHDRNPNFKKVALHVVWEDLSAPNPPASDRPVTLALKTYLDAPPAELAVHLEHESGLPEDLRGKCSAPLRELEEPSLTRLLHAAAQVRFQNKAGVLLVRARHGGWEQSLWEHLFRAMGYKHNQWPMQHLAETLPIWRRGMDSAGAIQARLLGLSGLLPHELTRSQKTSDTYLRAAWDRWWRDRDEFSGCSLPRAAWRFHGLRPANHPQRRLALVSHWLASKNLVARIENWSLAQMAEPGLAASLHEILQGEPDEFWAWHWTMKSTRLAKPQPLLGAARVTDLAINVILPWLWVRAREGDNHQLMMEMERRYLAWPAAEDNSVLKLARQRLLGASRSQILNGAAKQQGLMQIVRDFCGYSNAVCTDCRFPGLVRHWQPTVT